MTISTKTIFTTKNGTIYTKTSHTVLTEFLLNNRAHRENGPALEWANGSKEWRLVDGYFTDILPEDEHQERVKQINQFFEYYSIGDLLPENLILLEKLNYPEVKLFSVYNIRTKDFQDVLVYDLVASV